MSIQSDAAKAWLRRLLADEYEQVPMSASEMKQNGGCFKRAAIRSVQKDMQDGGLKVFEEYYFTDEANWRFDYAVPSLKMAIEVMGGNFMRKVKNKAGDMITVQGGQHANAASLRNWYERHNAAEADGWHVFYFMPEQIIKAGRKTMKDEPILKKLPWI